jgi:membrane-bound lytic murein transglycosylase D
MIISRSNFYKAFSTICSVVVLGACAPVNTGDLDREHRAPQIVAVEENRDFIWGLSGNSPPAEVIEVIIEQEERLQGDVEPEPEQTKEQELQDLKLLGKCRQVQYYLDFFSGKHRDHFARWLSRSGRYLPMIHGQLRAAGLPEDLAYLAMIESGYNERAYSRARAVGVWQFIKATGRNYGLKINTYVDERRDPIKSTQAAVSYLGDLYSEFGSWYLAVAAYNAGEGKIRRAIKKYNTTDFWEIAQGKYLRLETKRYVPKLIAAIIIAKEPEKYGFDYIEYAPPLAFETVEVPRWTALKAVALACDMEPADLKKYNNELRKEFTPPDNASYPLRVPVGKKETVDKNLPRVQAVVSTGFKSHTVKAGETLDGVCRKYGLTKTVVLKSNNLRSSGLKAGQRLRIPYQTTSYEMLPEGSVAKGYLATEAAGGNFVLHKVLPGETVYELSNRYSVPIHLIAAWNDLNDISRIRAGQQLVFYVQRSDTRIAALSSGSDLLQQLPAERTKENTAPETKPEQEQVKPATTGNAQQDEGPGQYYVIRKGDSLWSIARQFDLDTQELKRLNGLATNDIFPGDRIKVSESQTAGAEFYYHVRSGDSLWTIARRHNISPDDIKRWNNLKGNTIYPGNRLLLKLARGG